jgi:TPR repeat protein
MTSSRKITASVAFVVMLGGAAIAWQVYKAKAKERTLAEGAQVSRMSAERGDAVAAFRLGKLYYSGQGVSQDYTEAIRWYRRAADQGDAKAQYSIGYMYDLGQGVPQDYAEALRWYRKAADQGDANAQCGLGSMYYDGRGVSLDRAGAASWYRQAADRGLARAQYDLGYMYYYGQGVPQNRTEADRWYHKAADQGDERAQRALGLRGRGLIARSAVGLLAMSLGCLWVLKDSPSPRQGLQTRHPRALTLAGLFGLAYVAMSLYRMFGVFDSELAVNVFYFIENLVVGISIAVAVSVFAPKGAKFVFGISVMLFIGTNFIVIAHHELRHFAATVRGFSMANGLFLGISIPLAFFLWRTYRRSRSEGNWVDNPLHHP